MKKIRVCLGDLNHNRHFYNYGVPLNVGYIAATLDPNLRTAAIGIVLLGLVPLIIIPFLDKYVVKSKHHIAIGDHEDLKKDLKAKHK